MSNDYDADDDDGPDAPGTVQTAVAVMRLTDDPEVAKLADEVRSRLERVRSALAPWSGTA